MIPARNLSRSVPRALNSSRGRVQRGARFQSTSAGAASSGSSSTSHIAAGLAGGVAGAALLVGAYSFTPSGRMASNINTATKELNKKYQEAAKKLQQATPDADQAVNHIKQLCYSYVGWIPGGRPFVDAAFRDYDVVREKHRDEVDKLVNDAYSQLRDVAKSGLSLETASKAYDVLADLSKKIAELASDAIGDILDNHPQLKDKVGGNIDQLKQLGDQYGPEAKKQVDDTWRQVKEILAGGFTIGSIDKIRRLIDEKTQQIQKLGDEAWQKGLEQAKPFLDKNPKLKQLIEDNASALKQGNVSELFGNVSKAVESGDTGRFEEYIKSAVGKAQEKGSQLKDGAAGGASQFFKLIPQGSEILPKLQQLGEVAKAHSKEAEQLVKETMDELSKLLDDKAKKAEKIVEKAKKDAK